MAAPLGALHWSCRPWRLLVLEWSCTVGLDAAGRRSLGRPLGRLRRGDRRPRHSRTRAHRRLRGHRDAARLDRRPRARRRPKSGSSDAARPRQAARSSCARLRAPGAGGQVLGDFELVVGEGTVGSECPERAAARPRRTAARARRRSSSSPTGAICSRARRRRARAPVPRSSTRWVSSARRTARAAVPSPSKERL